MEYEPNSYAVNLRTNKSKVLGLIVPAISNMFNESFISAVENEARKSGYSLMILQSGDDPFQESENLKLCKHYRVDGIFISLAAESYSSELFNKYKEAAIPIIFFDRVPEASNFDTVCMADEEAATIAAHTIITYKKKNVLALFGNPVLSITKKRKYAFLKLLDKEKEVAVEVQHCKNSADATAHVTKAIENPNLPDHIFCMSDEILIGVMRVLKNSPLRIPEDVSVLAMSNGFIPGLFTPEISYIETSGYELGKLAINRSHPDFPAFQVLNTVLGGYFGSRLMANIREDKGYTYGIGSGAASLKHAGYFFIATEVGADVCQNALTEIYKEIELLRTEKISEDELNLVRNYMLGSLLGSLENIFSHADKFKNLYFSNLSYDYYSKYIDTVKNISAERIQEIAQSYLVPSSFVEVVVGKTN